MNLLELGIAAVERGIVPDWVTRLAIRRLCRQRLRECEATSIEAGVEHASFLKSLHDGPIAPIPAKANEQHYELPAEFFAAFLGPHRKYSCCFWPTPDCSLAEAEEHSLRLTCEGAEIRDGQDILELGCGWGSLTLWIAERYPHSRITAISNSRSQRRFIEAAAQERGLANVRVITADMNDFAPQFQNSDGGFDRIVSVEMFEHMRNYELLLSRIAGWLRPAGQLFVHYFCHRDWAYPFSTDKTADWMGRYFFAGGMMPCADMLRRFDCHLRVSQQRIWNGLHYQRTADAWLRNLDAQRGEVLAILGKVYGRDAAPVWLQRWRVFLLAVSELFGYGGGQEWFVSHCLLQHAHIAALTEAPCIRSR
ncbi:MAG: cyclopropane-fatty-acyl-phospholipid synthase family protein [Singulisphaera sp.]